MQNAIRRVLFHPFVKFGAITTGWFHLGYWSLKFIEFEKVRDRYLLLSTGGRKIDLFGHGLIGLAVGSVATLIWPISTPLTMMNIHERVSKGYGFFFPYFSFDIFISSSRNYKWAIIYRRLFCKNDD